MLGLGETRAEVLAVLSDLAAAGCRIVTVGQYLAPSMGHFPVARFALPEEFEELAEAGRALGIATMHCGPLVRSSYHAGELVSGPASARPAEQG